MKTRNVIRLISVIGIVFFLILISTNNKKRETNQARIEACQELATTMEDLYLEATIDYANMIAVTLELINSDISGNKFQQEIEFLTDNSSRRNYIYENTLNKYEIMCHGVK